MDNDNFTAQAKGLVDSFSPEDFMNKTVPLNHDDYALIGKLVQAYCWADFNGRRVLELLWSVNGTLFGRKAASLRDGDVIKELGIESEKLEGMPGLKKGLMHVFEILNMHKDRRHELAHWAARKLKDIDAFLMLSKNTKESNRRGIDINGELGGDDDFVGYAVMPIRELRDECEKLLHHNEYLAKSVKLLTDHLEGIHGCPDVKID
jgi:hypothetical protein